MHDSKPFAGAADTIIADTDTWWQSKPFSSPRQTELEINVTFTWDHLWDLRVRKTDCLFFLPLGRFPVGQFVLFSCVILTTELLLKDDIVITFANPRPLRMELLWSADFGKTWNVWQYYDSRCDPGAFPGVSDATSPDNPTAILCKTSDSTIVRHTWPSAPSSLDFLRFFMFHFVGDNVKVLREIIGCQQIHHLRK